MVKWHQTNNQMESFVLTTNKMLNWFSHTALSSVRIFYADFNLKFGSFSLLTLLRIPFRSKTICTTILFRLTILTRILTTEKLWTDISIGYVYLYIWTYRSNMYQVKIEHLISILKLHDKYYTSLIYESKRL